MDDVTWKLCAHERGLQQHLLFFRFTPTDPVIPKYWMSQDIGFGPPKSSNWHRTAWNSCRWPGALNIRLPRAHQSSRSQEIATLWCYGFNTLNLTWWDLALNLESSGFPEHPLDWKVPELMFVSPSTGSATASESSDLFVSRVRGKLFYSSFLSRCAVRCRGLLSRVVPSYCRFWLAACLLLAGSCWYVANGKPTKSIWIANETLIDSY